MVTVKRTYDSFAGAFTGVRNSFSAYWAGQWSSFLAEPLPWVQSFGLALAFCIVGDLACGVATSWLPQHQASYLCDTAVGALSLGAVFAALVQGSHGPRKEARHSAFLGVGAALALGVLYQFVNGNTLANWIITGMALLLCTWFLRIAYRQWYMLKSGKHWAGFGLATYMGLMVTLLLSTH